MRLKQKNINRKIYMDYPKCKLNTNTTQKLGLNITFSDWILVQNIICSSIRSHMNIFQKIALKIEKMNKILVIELKSDKKYLYFYYLFLLYSCNIPLWDTFYDEC